MGTILTSYVTRGGYWNPLAHFSKRSLYHMPHVFDIQMEQAEWFQVKWFRS